MRRLLVPVVIFVVALAGFLLWWNQPERVVTRRVVSFFNDAQVSQGSGQLVRGSMASSLEKYLAPRIALKGSVDEAEGDFARDNLLQMYGALASYAKRISIEKPEISAIEILGDQAKVHARIDAIVEVPGRSVLDGIQEVDMTWIKADNGWQLSAASWKEVPR